MIIRSSVAFFLRWIESTLWLPVCIALALGAWLVLGALDRTAALDVLPLLTILPIKIAYAVAALALTHLVRRRWRYKLDAQRQAEFWSLAQAGSGAAFKIMALDAGFTLCSLLALLYYFRLPA